ncbi:hypothetical protein DEO72_LG10g1270 [Vigna unguiculata]|uniref:Uncharacterized protein n=1 Tax=Vigna unguiculata TaxID=3917 RepID=A0A4D6NB95_VIGUN|nr:hypothetical protein DEO72_LG10g1270 [Vigna unguiculata]
MKGLRFWCARVGGDFVMKKTQRWFTVVRELQEVAAVVPTQAVTVWWWLQDCEEDADVAQNWFSHECYVFRRLSDGGCIGMKERKRRENGSWCEKMWVVAQALPEFWWPCSGKLQRRLE